MENDSQSKEFPKRTFAEAITEDVDNGKADAKDNDLDDEKIAPNEVDPLRVCLQGLDPYSTEKDLLKSLRNMISSSINIDAIAKSKGKNHAFISFVTIEDRQQFEKELAGKKLKNKKVKIRPVKLGHNTLKFEKKVKAIEESIGKPRDTSMISEEEIKKELSVSIQEKVCPLWKTPYEEQIKIKREALTNVLKKIKTNSLKQLKQEDKDLSFLPTWLKGEPDTPCCPVTDFLEADEPNRFYYRNKGEFTIGESYDNKGEIKVGFNKGNFSKGIMYVESAQECPIVSKESLALAQILEDYVKTSKIPIYHRIEHHGFWRNLIVRQSEKTKSLIINVAGAKKNISEEEYNQVKTDLVELFTTKFKDTDYKIVSIILQDHSGVSDNVPYDSPIDIIYGDSDSYMDEILTYKFRVNVNAFLQVNSSQCEKLYKLIKDLAKADSETVFLDICCGIGTIGICCAENAKKIVGVEMVDRAIKDAEYNSQLNGFKNTEYYCAKVENVITDIIKPYAGKNKIIGVVDPPRAGLHKDVIKALRTCKGLDTLIYVSCNPEGSAIDNIMNLCLPETKRRKAPPFTVIEAYGVDLFPQTYHYEGVFLLKRLYEKNYQ